MLNDKPTWLDAVRPPCKHEHMVDLTNGKGKLRHYYCHKCDTHIWKGKTWTKQEWSEYVNDMREETIYKPEPLLIEV